MDAAPLDDEEKKLNFGLLKESVQWHEKAVVLLPRRHKS
jgi:hypothetical protein